MKHADILSRLTLEEKCHLLSGRGFWQTRGVQRLGIESVTLADGPHGLRRMENPAAMTGVGRSLPATCYPTATTMASAWDIELSEALGHHLGVEAASQNVGVLLGPGLNIKRNPLCGRNFEYFSEDPYLAGKLAAAYVRGIQQCGVSACLKHFAANNTELRRMASNSVLDERTLREIYLTGFEIAVKEGGAQCVMAAYNEVNGVYASENRHLLQRILRDEWGFDGFVVSDWGACNDFAEGVQAGCNLEMPSTCGDSPRRLMAAVAAGRIAEDVVDARVDELLSVLLPVRAALDKTGGRPFDLDDHHAFARQCSEASIVLLKNEGGILPLPQGARVAVIGDFARHARYQGAGSSQVNCTRLENAMNVIGGFDLNVAGFEPGFPRHGATDPELMARAVALAKGAEYALLYLGLDEVSESEGLDRRTMALPQCQTDLLNAVAGVNPNVVVVLSAGSPVEMPWLSRCRALVHGGLGGQAGASAMLRVLTGAVNPSGKLSESYPFKYEDCPSAPYFPAKARSAEYREGLYVGYRYYCTAGTPMLFPFGFGLSYTAFEYSDIRMDGRSVKFTLSNTGGRDGAEVAQLYVSAISPSVHRPVRELKGFAKVFLKAGERREVTIPLDDKAFRFWNSRTNRFETDGGSYRLQIGASAEDIRLSIRVRIRGSGAPSCEDPAALPHYFSGDIRAVSDAEFERLLGHPIPDGRWSGDIGMNDAVAQLYYARSLKARLFWKLMTARLNRSLARGRPDLTTVYTYNMPIRGFSSLSCGWISRDMCEGLLDIINGHAAGFFRGMRKLIAGFFSLRRTARRAKRL